MHTHSPPISKNIFPHISTNFLNPPIFVQLIFLINLRHFAFPYFVFTLHALHVGLLDAPGAGIPWWLRRTIYGYLLDYLPPLWKKMSSDEGRGRSYRHT